MAVHFPSIFLAAAVALFIAAAASGSAGLQQRARRGTWWWLAANALLVVSLALQAVFLGHDLARPVAALLALQWPIVALAGVRQFYSRGAALVPAWADGVVLAVVSMVAAGTWLAPFDFVSPEQVFALTMLAGTIYAAATVWRLEDFATTQELKALLGGLVVAAAVQLAGVFVAFTGMPFRISPATAGAVATLATAVLALLMTQLTPAMNHERQIARLRASQRKLRHMVDVDPLTQLPNRRHFHELAEKVVKTAPELATVIVFDVDQLQRINELLGHANGDEALRQIGTAFRETLRRRDVAGRLGGDEFAAVLPRTRAADAANVVARIKVRLDDRQVAPRIAKVVLNVGITQMQKNEPFADALRRAEISLGVARDENRRLAAQSDEIVAEASALRSGNARASQFDSMHGIPVGEVSMVGALP